MAKAVTTDHITQQIAIIDSRIDKAAIAIEKLKVERQVLSKLLGAAEEVSVGENGRSEATPLRLTDAVRQYLAEHGPATRRAIVEALRERVHSDAENVDRSLLSTISTLKANNKLMELEGRRLMLRVQEVNGSGTG